MSNLFFAPRDRPRKGRASPLPTFNNKGNDRRPQWPRQFSQWFTPVFIRIPWSRERRLRLFLPFPAPIRTHLEQRLGRRPALTLLTTIFIFLLWVIYAFSKHGLHFRRWQPPFLRDPPTLVFSSEDLTRIWQWEVASGHYQSSRPLPSALDIKDPFSNPGIPKPVSRPLNILGGPVNYTIGTGSDRVYLDLQSQPPNVAYPPRPVPGSIADLDIVMDHCDFSTGKYVRDCLELLRIGGGLDNGKRFRRTNTHKWNYIYRETSVPDNTYVMKDQPFQGNRSLRRHAPKKDVDAGIEFRDPNWIEPPLDLPDMSLYRPFHTLDQPCDPKHPRLYHMFWAGPFTDKPYLALLSFLYTQNIGLNLPPGQNSSPSICRPVFWMWINPGAATANLNNTALRDMYDGLAANPWASPFLHPRFKGIIEFKLWNTTEQLDGVEEIRHEWRKVPVLFNAGGHKYTVKSPAGKGHQTSEIVEANLRVEEPGTKAADPSPTNAAASEDKNIYNMVGSSSASEYDRLSVILSDMARFILCHRFGGTYLDADTILLRDWEELWGWKGAFAYRWSRLEKYNTAVLRMNKGSALGSFLFRTALRNELDFHPMTVTRYMKDAYLEPLLLRLPDALFDSAWLNTEDYQRDRPPYPYFLEFGDLFHGSQINNAAPQPLGLEGFFRGAYSYHYHNSWWKPFDPARNYPDLGHRFAKGEAQAKAKLRAAAVNSTTVSGAPEPTKTEVRDDARDLEWATVIKRTFEGFIRGDRPNMYGEWLVW